MDDYAVRYYYKRDGNYFSFVLQIGETTDCFVDFGINLINKSITVSGVKLVSNLSEEYLNE